MPVVARNTFWKPFIDDDDDEDDNDDDDDDDDDDDVNCRKYGIIMYSTVMQPTR